MGWTQYLLPIVFLGLIVWTHYILFIGDEREMVDYSGWISVEDKLPDSFQKVLVWREAIGYDIAWIGYGHWIYDNLIEGIEVVAWMPLPEPPRMEEE
nr:MAG TPA: Protein of unknown function (DUF551) [Caudoviricetes sp.]